MKKTKYSNYLLFLFAAILGFLSFRESPYVGICVLLSLIASIFYDRYLTIALYVFISFMGINLSTIEVLGELVIVSAVGLSNFHINNNGIRKLLIAVVLFSISILFGSIFHPTFELDSLILYIFKLFIMLVIAQVVVDSDDKLILRAVLLAAIIMTVITGYLYAIGDLSIYTEYSGRLMYNGNVKDLATAIVIPVIFTFDKLMDYKNLRNKSEMLFYGVVLGLCLAILLLTYARGVLIGLVVAVFALVITYSKNVSFSRVLIFAIIAFLLLRLVASLQLNTNVMFENIEGGDGRTDIYLSFIKYMEEIGGSALVWGLGTGSITYVAGGNPHSVILAHYFFFGIFGALFILYILGKVFIKLMHYRVSAPFYFALFLQTIVMYSAHGTYSDPRFWLTIGLCAGIAIIRIDKHYPLYK